MSIVIFGYYEKRHLQSICESRCRAGTHEMWIIRTKNRIWAVACVKVGDNPRRVGEGHWLSMVADGADPVKIGFDDLLEEWGD